MTRATLTITRTLPHCHACGTVAGDWDCCTAPEMQTGPCEVEVAIEGEPTDQEHPLGPSWDITALLDGEPYELSATENARAIYALCEAAREAADDAGCEAP